MLPCRSTCPLYQCGCHKSCARWQTFLETQNAQREAKKRYLQFYTAQCAQMTRQYAAMQTRRPAW